MATSLELCNAALMRLGAEPINAFSDDSKRAKLCDAHYERIKRDFISSSPWNFALKRVILDAENDTFTTTDVNIGTDEVTITGHGKQTGQRVNLKVEAGSTVPGGLLAGNTYYLIRVDANTVQFAESREDAAAGTQIDITSIGSGTTTMFYAPIFGFNKQYDLPNDYLRIFRASIDSKSSNAFNANFGFGYANSEVEYQIEQDKILSTEEEFTMIYIFNAKEKWFTPYFEKAFILKLAEAFSYTLIQSNENKELLQGDLENALRDARLYDSQEGTPYPMTADAWTIARL